MVPSRHSHVLLPLPVPPVTCLSELLSPPLASGRTGRRASGSGEEAVGLHPWTRVAGLEGVKLRGGSKVGTAGSRGALRGRGELGGWGGGAAWARKGQAGSRSVWKGGRAGPHSTV